MNPLRKDKNTTKSLERLFFWKHSNTGVDKRDKIDVDNQWKIAFFLMTLAGLFLVVFEIYLFTQIDSNNIFTVVSTDSVDVETLDRSELEDVLKYYDEKERSFQRILESKATYPRPPEEEIVPVEDAEVSEEAAIEESTDSLE